MKYEEEYQLKKQKLWRPLTVGLTAMMLAAPVYAEEIQTPAMGADTSVTQTAPSSHQEENKLAPYIGKTITKQIIEGNVAVPEAEIAAALKTKPGMQFTEAGLSEDLSAIYDLGWFYDLRPEFKTVPEGVQVIYHVMENPVYQKTEVEGNTVLNKQRVASFFDLEQGKIANLKNINKCVQKLEEEYRSNGYILARVTDVHMEKDGTLKVAVNEGVVEGFKVKGNVKTKDYVVTREMKLKKGEPFNAKAARRSMQRVYNLGYFEDVNIKLNPGREPNGVEVEISVVEMNTGTFGIGAGYSNADGFVGMVSIGDKNFRGIGDKINLRWEFGGEDNKNYDFSYTRPWLDDTETSATLTFTISPTNMPIIISTVMKLPATTKNVAVRKLPSAAEHIMNLSATTSQSKIVMISTRARLTATKTMKINITRINSTKKKAEKLFIKVVNMNPGCLRLPLNAVKKTLVLPAVLPSAAYMIPATTSMIRMKASALATA